MTRHPLLSLIVISLVHTPAVFALDAVYYSETGFGDTISHLTIDPTVAAGVKTDVVTIPNKDPRGSAVDEVNGHIYYADGLGISRSGLDGSSPTPLITLGVTPSDMEVDPVGGKLYYATTFTVDSTIFSANLDGTGVAVVQNAATLISNMAPATVTTRVVNNISINPDANLLYWTADDGGVAGRIGLNSTSLTGGAVTQHWVGTSRGDSISKMDIDFDTGKLYYSLGSTANAVFRSNIDNSSLETLASGLGRPGALAIDGDNDVLAFAVGGKVFQRKLDGTAVSEKTISTSTLFSIADMHIASTTAIPEPSTLALLLATGMAMMGLRGRR